MPVYVPFMGHKEMAPPGATLLCQPLPHCPFLPIFYCPLLSCSLPTPHPGADLKTTAFFQLLLAFPDLLPQPRQVTLLAGLGRAWLGPQHGTARAARNSASAAEAWSCPGLRKLILIIPPVHFQRFSVCPQLPPLGTGWGWIRCVLLCLSFRGICSDNCSDQTARLLTRAGAPHHQGPLGTPGSPSLSLKVDSSPGSVSKPS